MEIRDSEFDPVEFYHKELKETIKNNAGEYFDKLLKKSGVDLNVNKSLYKKYVNANNESEEASKRLRRHKLLRVFLWVLVVIGIIACAIGVYSLISNGYTLPMLITAIVGGLIAIALLIVIFIPVKNKIKILVEESKHKDEFRQKCERECYEQISPLYQMFSDEDFLNIVKQSTSIFSLDPVLKPEKLAMFKALYNCGELFDNDESVTEVSSGDIATNPFIRFKTYKTSMFNKVYTGSITIHWTETRRDSDGDLVTVHRSQVLTASVTRPAPMYYTGAYVVYGNEAAPNLSFSRQPCKLNKDFDEKDVEKYVKKVSKDMIKLSQDSIENGGSFQIMGNEKFEALFGCTDRNNEVEFRLLFTPLAQTNMTDLILQKEPYPDDFVFVKRNKLNIICSEHAKHKDFSESQIGKILSGEEMRTNFIDLISQHFASLFFELAPILCIPLYQLTEAGKFDPKQYSNVSSYEAESVCNLMDHSRFAHPETCTSQILKARYKSSIGKTDIYDIESHSYREDHYVENVTVMGGDGRLHIVPVPYSEFVPLVNTTPIAVKQFDNDAFELKKFARNFDSQHVGTTWRRRVMSFFYDKNYSEAEDSKIEKEENDFISNLNS